ncbi:hypothetical protein TanjilG_06011 [Lupinus angustifolius]|uniref:Uncharacterized protein n=1 Tax=Lupinus angustifolius TaxID=3871 RepID=A0A4P1RIZ7_LUPAN|nr:hypothetical protein TanjilG_06011 [Lupinus angustifolius]
MKRVGTRISYSHSSSSNQNHKGNFALVLAESSKKTKKSTKTRCEIVKRENGRCEICAEIARKTQQKSSEVQKVDEEKRQEVVEENVVVIIDDINEEQKKDTLEEKMEGNVVEEKVENNKVEEEKIVIMDDGVDVETLLDDADKNAPLEGGERNGDGVVVEKVVEEKNEDLFSFDIIGESNLLSGWDEWKYEVETNWDCSYPSWWDSDEKSEFNFEGVESSNSNDWVESLWQL